MQKLYTNLYLVNDDAVTNGTGAVFLLTRNAGNVLFATKADMNKHAGAILDKGPVTHMLVGDRHHVSAATIKLAKTLEVPLTASEEEANVLKKKKLSIANPVPLIEQMVVKNLTALPTPGHTQGALSYLYTTASRRFLFVGDTLVPADGEWKIWVSKASRDLMRQTLESLLTSDFDVLLCNSFAATDGSVIELTKREKNSRLRAAIKSLSD